MAILDRRIDGVIIILLWLMLVIVKRLVTGSLMGDKPDRGVFLWAVHLFNFSFLLVANPAAALMLIFAGEQANSSGSLSDAAGAALVAAGYLLMAWALMTLRRNYQVGGNGPRASDELVIGGPYCFVRHPMYSAAMAISLGLACLTQHAAFFLVFCIYVFVILMLIPVEERGLERAYGERYVRYEKSVKRLIPQLY